MDYPTIRALLDRYWAGETTLAEEERLRAYFRQAEALDERLKVDAAWFGYTQTQAAQRSQRQLPILRTTRQRRLWSWAAAASIIVLLSISWWQSYYLNKPLTVVAEQVEEDTYEDPEEAFRATKRALLRLSKELNQGVASTQAGLKRIHNQD